jgi:predicted TPR repeat methyltransferase
MPPARCADALRDCGVSNDAAILDIGCGTGLSGEAIHAAGYTTLDGTDFSAEMLAHARAKGLYRTLVEGDLDALPEGNRYGAAVAAGVFSPGHAPAILIDTVLERLEPDGVFVFSLNDHAVADGSYDGRVHELIDTGGADLLFREYGPHMPGQDVQAWVLALRAR